MTTTSYRRELSRQEWLQVLGIGAGAGVGVGLAVAVAATYMVRLYKQKTPVRPYEGAAGAAEREGG